VPETLMPALVNWKQYTSKYRKDPAFQEELQIKLRDYVVDVPRRNFAERLTTHYARLDGTGPQISLKRV